MNIRLTHNNIAWVLIINDYDYVPEQKETGPRYASGGEPGFPKSIEFNEYYLELERKIDSRSFSSPVLIDMINNQLAESNRLCEHLFKLYSDDICEEALMLYHEDLWL